MSRTDYLYRARGIGIFLVVFGHVQRGLSDAHLLRANYPFHALDFGLYTFHMPLFFLLAGLYVWPSLEKGSGRYLKTKLSTIVAPYFIWSIIQGAVQIAMAGKANHPLSISDWPKLFYDPIGQFWFLYALFIWQLLALACQNFKMVLYIIAAVAFIASHHFHNGFIRSICDMGLFFAAGTMLGGDQVTQYVEKFATPPRMLGLLVLFLSAVYGEFYYDPTTTGSWPTLPSAMLGITFILALSFYATSARLNKLLTTLGERSMDIYVMHIMAAAGARIVLTRLGITNMAAHLIFDTLIGMVLPYLLSPYIDRVTAFVSVRQLPRRPAK